MYIITFYHINNIKIFNDEKNIIKLDLFRHFRYHVQNFKEVPLVYAYMRQVPNLANLAIQKRDIISFALNKGFEIDQEVVESATKNLYIEQRKDFETFLKSLERGNNTVIVSSLSILSTRVDELVKIINCVLSHSVNLWIVNVKLCINKNTNIVEIFPLLEKQREKTKEVGKHIGRPKGSKSSSKFDIYHNKIISLLVEENSVSAIARELNVSRSSLKDYIESRGIKELVSSIGSRAYEALDKEMDNIVLVCPFEAEKIREA